MTASHPSNKGGQDTDKSPITSSKTSDSSPLKPAPSSPQSSSSHSSSTGSDTDDSSDPSESSQASEPSKSTNTKKSFLYNPPTKHSTEEIEKFHVDRDHNPINLVLVVSFYVILYHFFTIFPYTNYNIVPNNVIGQR